MNEAPAISSADQTRQALASWLSAFNTRDLEGLMALYDPEAVYANDAAPLMRGTVEIRPWFEGAFVSSTATAIFEEEALFQGADLSLIVGKFTMKPSEEESSSEPGETGRVAVAFRRSDDGQWRLVFDMDNRPPDAEIQDFT